MEPKEHLEMYKFYAVRATTHERCFIRCSCGRPYLLIPIDGDIVHCRCGKWIDSRNYSLSETLRSQAKAIAFLDNYYIKK